MTRISGLFQLLMQAALTLLGGATVVVRLLVHRDARINSDSPQPGARPEAS